jgi:hypothetical protein
MGLKQLKTLKKEHCLINPSVYSALQKQTVLLRKEIYLTAEWYMSVYEIDSMFDMILYDLLYLVFIVSYYLNSLVKMFCILYV